MSFRTAHSEKLRQGLWPVLSGVLTSLGFAPASVPVATLTGMTMLIALLRAQAREGVRLRASMAAGLLYGLGFAVPLLWWMRVVSPGAHIALAFVQAALIAVSIAAVRLVIALPGWPILATGVWMTTEYLRGSYPFGAFPGAGWPTRPSTLPWSRTCGWSAWQRRVVWCFLRLPVWRT